MDISCLSNVLKPDTLNKGELATLKLASNATEIKFIDPNDIHLIGESGGFILINDCATNRTELIKVGVRTNSGGITTFPILGRGYNPNDCITANNASTGYEFPATAEFYVGYADKKYWCELLACIKSAIEAIKGYVDANTWTCDEIKTCVQPLIDAQAWNCAKTIDCMITQSQPNQVYLDESSYLFGVNCDGALSRVRPMNRTYSATSPDFTFAYSDGDKIATFPGYYWRREIALPSISLPANCGNKKLRLITQLDFRPSTSPQPSRSLNLFCSGTTLINGSAGDTGVGFSQGGTSIIAHNPSFLSDSDVGPTLNFTGYYDLAVGTNSVVLRVQINDPSINAMGSHSFTINSIILRGEIL